MLIMSSQSGEGRIQADREWVLDAVPRVSRTFALTIEILEDPMASWIATGYLLCRTADTIEDDPELPPETRADLLETFEAMVDPASDVSVDEFLSAVEEVRPDADGDDWDVLTQTDRTMRVLESFDSSVQQAMRGVSREMATGMATVLRRHADAGGLRLRSIDELEEYCWYVAGTVGELFTGLMECRAEEAPPDPDPEDARAFALLLQLVNVAKDVRADWADENNVYLPGEWLAAEGVDHDAVADPDQTEAVTRVVGRLLNHAGEYADGARRYLHKVPDQDNLFGATALPYLLALGTIRELQGQTRAAVEQHDAVKLERSEVAALFDRVEDGISQGDLTEIAQQLQHEPYSG
jgi:farnesyl-diphosphate farnesyltransferase